LVVIVSTELPVYSWSKTAIQVHGMSNNSIHSRNVLGCLALGLSLLAQGSWAQTSSIPSISIGALIDIVSSDNIPRSAIRGQFLSELAQSYECNILTRWSGPGIAPAKSVHEGLPLTDDEVQAADYVMCGSYADIDHGLQGIIFCTSLESAKTLEGTFKTLDPLELPARLAQATAALLSLNPRKPDHGTNAISSTNLIWMINPILRCSPGWGVAAAKMDVTLAEQIEEALQQQQAVKRIAGLQTLSEIVREHNLTNAPVQGVARVRMLAKLNQVDILLTGQVSQEKGKNSRVDLFLLNSRNGDILAACTARDVPEQNLSATCIDLALRLAKTPIVMPKSNPATSAKRRQEAELLMSRDNYPKRFAAGGFSFTRVRSDLEAGIATAESAYLLMPNDSDFVYQSIVDLWEGYKQWGWWNTPRPGDNINRYEFKKLDCMQRTASLINQALQPAAHSDRTPTPLLYRAEALMYAGRYLEAIELAEQHRKQCPAIEDGWSLEILAQSHFKLGHSALAEDFASRSLAQHHNSWFTPDMLSDLKRDRTARDLKTAATLDDRSALAVYRRLLTTNETYITIQDWKRYLELLRTVDGPQKAIDIHQFMWKDIQWFTETTLIREVPEQTLDPDKFLSFTMTHSKESDASSTLAMFHIAACYAELAQPEKAARICKNIMFHSGRWRSAWGYVPILKQSYQEAEQLCKTIESRRGPVSELWKTGQEVKPITGQYCVYVVPLGSFNQNRLAETLKELTSFFGEGGVALLPTLPSPQEALPKGAYSYTCRPLFNSIFKSLTVPSNALHVAIVTELPFDDGIYCAGQLTDENAPAALSPVVLSFRDFQSGITPDTVRSLSFASKIISSFHYTYANKPTLEQNRLRAEMKNVKRKGYGVDREICFSWTCIFSVSLDQIYTNANSIRQAMCAKCQQEYLQADFEKIHQNLMNYCKTVGVRIGTTNAVMNTTK
jgi:tetratricopeptide (TPR) repeat protein